MTATDTHQFRARALAGALEPFAGQVHFSPECHAEYVALGFGGCSGLGGRTQRPDREAYFTSRGSVMGQIRGTVVASAFAVFNPDVVAPAVERGWAKTDAPTICDARRRGAVAQLRRILGDEPTGVTGALRCTGTRAAGAGPPTRWTPPWNDCVLAAWWLKIT
jgi:hypothetical protein